MPTKSPAERLQSRDAPAGARSRGMRQYARVRSVGVPGLHRSGDTDALDWRSDPRLLAILARVAQRERSARGKDQFPWRRDELTSQLEAGARPHRHAFKSAVGA